MPYSRKISILIAAAIILAGLFFYNFQFFTASAQARLTYPEINTVLQTKLPTKNRIDKNFKDKAELISWLIDEILKRKIDKPLTKDREDDLRQAGATDELIEVIRANSPTLQTPTPTPVPRETVVDVGNLEKRVVNLVKPEYTAEARRAGVNSVVKLQLMLDEEGRVTSTKALSSMPYGMTEQAELAARQSTFTPASVEGKPVRSVGTITYVFFYSKYGRIDAASTLNLAEEYRSKNDCDRAIIEYTKAIKFNAKGSKAFFGRGLCNLINKSYDSAVTDLDTAAALDPADGEAFYYLAIAYEFKGESRTSPLKYRTAISLKPELAKRVLSECLYLDRKRLTKEEVLLTANGLIEACNSSLRASADFLASLIYLKRGLAYLLKSDYDNAISDFERAQKLNSKFLAVGPHLHRAYNSRGLLRFEKKDYKLAFEDISTAIKLNPKSPAPYINRCVIHLYAWKAFDQAISDCTTAIRLSTKSSMAYNHRGFAYEMKNSIEAAIDDYKKALEIDPRNETARANLNRVQDPNIKRRRTEP